MLSHTQQIPVSPEVNVMSELFCGGVVWPGPDPGKKLWLLRMGREGGSLGTESQEQVLASRPTEKLPRTGRCGQPWTGEQRSP